MLPPLTSARAAFCFIPQHHLSAAFFPTTSQFSVCSCYRYSFYVFCVIWNLEQRCRLISMASTAPNSTSCTNIDHVNPAKSSPASHTVKTANVRHRAFAAEYARWISDVKDPPKVNREYSSEYCLGIFTTIAVVSFTYYSF
jgi:hypothetical protein